MNDYTDHTVLDLFAGSGVGVALKGLGVEEYGVENNPSAIETRRINGMRNIFDDVWEPDHEGWMARADTLWASPPCQTFSMAGAGAGRRALDQVLSVIDTHDWKRSGLNDLKREALKIGDERIGLVLTPLAYAHFVQPEYILLEQVQPVLPVWERMAVELQKWGYSTWTGKLHAEQYGVPQTRTRAILIARRDGKQAAPPHPTRSKYYTTNPTKLDEGVEKWVSMYEALSRGMTARPSYTVTGGGTDAGGAEPFGRFAREGMQKQMDIGDWVLRSNYGTSGDPANRGERTVDQPAATLTSKAGRNKWVGPEDAGNLSVEEAAILQSYPGWGWTTRPAPTVLAAGVHGASGVELFDRGSRDKMIAGIATGEFVGNGRVVNPNTPLDPIRLLPAEHAILQSYPNGFEFAGNKGERYKQIGNAVPPLLADAIFREVWS